VVPLGVVLGFVLVVPPLDDGGSVPGLVEVLLAGGGVVPGVVLFGDALGGVLLGLVVLGVPDCGNVSGVEVPGAFVEGEVLGAAVLLGVLLGEVSLGVLELGFVVSGVVVVLGEVVVEVPLWSVVDPAGEVVVLLVPVCPAGEVVVLPAVPGVVLTEPVALVPVWPMLPVA